MKKLLSVMTLAGTVLSAVESVGDELTLSEKLVIESVARGIAEGPIRSVQKASVQGITVVAPILKLLVVGDDGKTLSDDALPPVLANLKADLSNTDIDGELRNAGIRVQKNYPATAFLAYVFCFPSFARGDLKIRKMFLVGGAVVQEATVGGAFAGKKLALVTATYHSRPLLSSEDDTKDAAAIRVEVRKVVDQFIGETGAKGARPKKGF